MAKPQAFNHMFVSTLLIFSILAVVLLLIMYNSKKEKYANQLPYEQPCKNNNEYILSQFNIPTEGLGYFRDGWVYKDGTLKCTKTNILRYPSEFKSFADGRDATCADLGMEDINKIQNEKEIYNVDNGWNAATPLSLTDGVKLYNKNENDCYLLPKSKEDITNVIKKINDFSNFTKNQTLSKLQSQQQAAANSAQVAEARLQTEKQAQPQNIERLNALKDRNVELKSILDSAQQQNTQAQSKYFTSKAQYDEKVPKFLDKFNAAEIRLGADNVLPNTKYIQKVFSCESFDRKRFSLMYKYASSDININDSSDLWFENTDYNTHLFSDPGSLANNLMSPNIGYRNKALINYYFGSQKPPAYVLVEIYNVNATSAEYLGYMLFTTKPNDLDDIQGYTQKYQTDGNFNDQSWFMESWFAPNRFVEGNIGSFDSTSSVSPVRDIRPSNWSKTGAWNFQYFSIRGDSCRTRRWFIAPSYGGCNRDTGIMCIPHGRKYNCGICEGRNGWDVNNAGKIMVTTNYDYSVLQQEPKTYAKGNVMMVWARNIDSDPYENLVVDQNKMKVMSPITVPL